MRRELADLDTTDLSATTFEDAITDYIGEGIADGRKPTWIAETERRLRQFFPAQHVVNGNQHRRLSL